MGTSSMFRDTTRGYDAVESFLFDRILRKLAAPLHAFATARIEPMVRPGMRILDVGCGGGQLALDLARRFPGVQITGLDLSPQQIARARRRGASLADRVTFVEGTAMDMPFSGGAFDLVYSVGSLKHWPDHARGLRECARVQKPGNRLFVMEGDRGCRHEDVQSFIASWDLPAPLRPLAVAFYRTTVVGQSLDLEDARALLASIPALDGSVERAPGLPAWFLDARTTHP